MKKIGIILIVGLAIAIGFAVLLQSNRSLKYDLSVAVNNEKAALAEADSLKDQSLMYQYTIDQLVYNQDSIVAKLNNVRKELKIKDRKVQELAYLLTSSKATDTIYVNQVDTIFKEPGFKLDTTIGDKWYKCDVGLQYPNVVTVSPEFVSEKSIVVSTRRETIRPPKKCWLSRLGQRKHTVVEVNVVEESPYIETKESKFIKIIK